MGLIESIAFPEQDEGPDAPIVDVEKVLGDQAWESFLHSYSCFWRCCIKKKNSVIDVPMNYYYFEQGKTDINLMESTFSANMVTTDANNKQGGSRRQATPEMIGLETRFNNDTDTEQKYNFNFQKERSASVEVTYQRGFSIGGKANFTLGIPKIAEDSSLGVEIETHVQVTKTTGEKHEERVTTSATSEITVAPHSHYTITVVMEERNLEATFKLSTHCIKLKQTEADRSNNTDADSPQNGSMDVGSRAAGIVGQRPGIRSEAARIPAEGRMPQRGPDAATSSRQSVIQVVEQRATDGVSVYFPNDY
ncbi:uncharacterized protein LOC112555642 [Pomacea canaliculata]|uniref:uncharacterized protein LOC112555642 n=1 Tax=Pomacea canaliculata TaxID=400727 RepID=UPI000D73AE64|nr:uncharacterized protein LOC112555642 [Pomacea canaliculata]